jgi:PII-like signaling protein
MPSRETAVLLRVFVGERARWEHRPLYEAIVMAARDAGLAGATVLRGMMGFGHHGRIEYAKILDLSDDLPVVVEIVDAEAKIESFLPILDRMMESGLVTLEKATVLRYGRIQSGEPTAKLRS